MSMLIQTDPPRPARETLPTMYDLPAEQVAEQERQRAERLAELLRQLGQDPDKL